MMQSLTFPSSLRSGLSDASHPSSSNINTTTLLRGNFSSGGINSTVTLTDQCRHLADDDADGQLYVNLNTFWYCFLAFITTIGLMISLVSNMIIIYLFTGTKSLRRNPSNIIAVNLSLSDLLYCIQWPSVIYCSLTQSTWILEVEFVCNTFGFITVTTASASVLTVLAMSVERAIVIKYSIYAKSRYTIRSAWLIVVLIWFISVASSLPPLFGKFNRFTLDPSKTSCTLDYLSGKTNYKLYILVVYVTYWILPTIIISICYTTILLTFKRSSSSLKKFHLPSCQLAGRKHSELTSQSLGEPTIMTTSSTGNSPRSRRTIRRLHPGSLRDSIRLNNFLGHLRHQQGSRRIRVATCHTNDDHIGEAPKELRGSKSASDLTSGPDVNQNQRRGAINGIGLRPGRLLRRMASVYSSARRHSSVAAVEHQTKTKPSGNQGPPLEPIELSLIQSAAIEEFGGGGGSEWQQLRRQQSNSSVAGIASDAESPQTLTNSICRISSNELADKDSQEVATNNNVNNFDNREAGAQCEHSLRRLPSWCRRKLDVSNEQRLARRRISFDGARLRLSSSEGPSSRPLGKTSPTTGGGDDQVYGRGRAQAVSQWAECKSDKPIQREENQQQQLGGIRKLMASDSDATISSAPSMSQARPHQVKLRTARSRSGRGGQSGLAMTSSYFDLATGMPRQPMAASAANYASTKSAGQTCHFGNSRTSIQIRLAKMSFYLILLWLVSWTPIASLAMINSVVKCHHRASALAVFLANTMTKLGPAFDVFIYGVSHPKIKKKFTLIIKRLFMVGDGSSNDTDATTTESVKGQRGSKTAARHQADRHSMRSNCSGLTSPQARTLDSQRGQQCNITHCAC